MQWFNIVKWVNFAMINAEELGVSSKTIDDALKSQKPSVKRLMELRVISASRSGLPRIGPYASCEAWAITPKCSTATSAQAQSSAFRAA